MSFLMYKSNESLLGICLHWLVFEAPCVSPKSDISSSKWTWANLPSDLYPRLLTEALHQRDCHVISALVAHWPGSVLSLKSLLPWEERITPRHLTSPVDGCKGSATLLDAVVMGLLTRDQDCGLTRLDLTGFENDRRMSIELARLPILWMHPWERRSDHLLLHVGNLLKFAQIDVLQNYLNKISIVYNVVDQEFKHGQQFNTVTIYFDCMIFVDEVALGLAIQTLTPFRFACKRLWLKKGSDVYLPPTKLICLFDPMKITHFELEECELSLNRATLANALYWISSLRNVVALSMPMCASPGPGLRLISRTLASLRRLRRLSLAHSNLQGHLRIILSGLSQPLSYLNIQDCRLVLEDIEYLCGWRPLNFLQELDLSNNNLSDLPSSTMEVLLRRTAVEGSLVCFSLSYTSISTEYITQILTFFSGMMENFCINCPLKVIGLQSFIPPPIEELRHILHLATTLPSLQVLILLPAVYAFLGENDFQRREARKEILNFCNRYLEQKDRSNIRVK